MAADMSADIHHKLDPDLKKLVSNVAKKLKKFKVGPRHLMGAAAGVAGLTGAASLGSSIGKGVGEKLTGSGHAKHAFWTGFGKRASEDSGLPGGKATTYLRRGAYTGAGATAGAAGALAILFPLAHTSTVAEKLLLPGIAAGAGLGGFLGYREAKAQEAAEGNEKKAEVSKEDLKKTLRKHEERETPAQERAESREEQKVEERAGMHEKKALMQTRRSEDLATAATSVLPLGTTLHTLAKDGKGGDSGKEWLARLVGAGAGGAGGLLLARLLGPKHLNHKNISKAINRQVALGTLGTAGGEVVANRMIHSGKYDDSGKLKEEYGGRHEKSAFMQGFYARMG